LSEFQAIEQPVERAADGVERCGGIGAGRGPGCSADDGAGDQVGKRLGLGAADHALLHHGGEASDHLRGAELHARAVGEVRYHCWRIAQHDPLDVWRDHGAEIGAATLAKATPAAAGRQRCFLDGFVQPLVDLLDHCREETELALEMMVEGASGELGCSGQFIQRDAGIAVTAERLAGECDQLGTCFERHLRPRAFGHAGPSHRQGRSIESRHTYSLHVSSGRG